jgi:phage terminase large subunit-like protein|nr:terminase family protein [Oricola indica]
MRARRSKSLSIDTLPPAMLKALPGKISDIQCADLLHFWPFVGRPAQLPPDSDWRNWLILAGRGFGKTRTGAEWLREQVKAGAMRLALIAPTMADARDVMIGGESGVLSVCWKGDRTHGGELLGRPVFEPTKRRLSWRNGATAMVFSAEEPDRLRGPQNEKIWADELCAWKYPQATWDMAMFGLRLGTSPQVCITTTPKPLGLLRDILKDPATAVTRGATFDNAANLAAGFLDTVRAKYEATNLGRQELYAEILDEAEGALWSRAALDGIRRERSPALTRIVVAVDPPAGSKTTSDACGIVAVGLAADRTAHVIADCSLRAAKPSAWAARAVALYQSLEADLILAEVNQGGDMVEAVIRQVDESVALKKVHAGRSKWLRAEPVAALYEQGRVTHARGLDALEDEMCAFGTDGLASGRSPDRLDALVWAMSDLMLKARGEPRVRGL